VSGVVVAYAAQVPAVTGRPDGSSLPRLGRWFGWAREFVARQPVAAFHSRVVCGSLPLVPNSVHVGSRLRLRSPHFAYVRPTSLTFAPTSLTFAPTPLTLALQTHQPCRAYPTHLRSRPILPGCKRLHLTFGPSWAAQRLLHFEMLDYVRFWCRIWWVWCQRVGVVWWDN